MFSAYYFTQILPQQRIDKAIALQEQEKVKILELEKQKRAEGLELQNRGRTIIPGLLEQEKYDELFELYKEII